MKCINLLQYFVAKDYCRDVTCQNGGSCSIVSNAMECTCQSGFDGPLCEHVAGNFIVIS